MPDQMPNDTPETPPGARDLSLSMRQVNLMAIPVSLIPAAAIILLYADVHGWGGFGATVGILRKPLASLLILVGGIILHELLHGAAWAYFGQKPLSAITFGVHWKPLTPFAHCRETLTVQAYRIGALTPAIVLGFVPALLSVFGGMPWLFMPAILFSVAAGGDLLIIWLLRKERSTSLVLDHPSRAGCLVYDPPSPQDVPA
jgi:hypothetical protein